VLAAILGYREGTRNHWLMNSPAEMLPSEVIPGLAAYISNLDGAELPSYAAGAPNERTVSRGAAVAEGMCFKCHGTAARMSKKGIPNLDGQYASYLLAAMREYRLGVRNHKRMYEITAGLSLEDSAAVAAYYAGLSGLFPSAASE
jgi:cytochrome c553